jgi:hypothetical protein
MQTLMKDFENVVEASKQEVARKYQAELKQVKNMVITLKNKYSDLLSS